MARVHLEVIFPGTGEPVSTMRFDTKHVGSSVLSQISKQKNDPMLEHSRLILEEKDSEYVWVKKKMNLKSLGTKNDMKLYVVPNPVTIPFQTLSERAGTVTFNPKATVQDILPLFSEAIQLTNSLGYSIFAVVQGREVAVDETVSLFMQVPHFER